MHIPKYPLLALLALAACRSAGPTAKSATTYSANPHMAAVTPSSSSVKYPETRKSDQVDDYHGTSVADLYRWLEDLDSPETKAWVEAQNKLTFGYLEKIPFRDQIRERLTNIWNYERYGVPQVEDGQLYFSKNDGLQNQAVLYVQKNAPRACQKFCSTQISSPPTALQLLQVLISPMTIATWRTRLLAGAPTG
ncbi:hypothetical protein [Hymenobacter sp. HDW8]|uniref:hypothetical protein n=1 Tax=Hymenobacter sp. HDW8 TaxID=2714932 RepID=UPI00293BE8BE|nr:hypothetical protein [Hymenobacter sp. HDW8]